MLIKIKPEKDGTISIDGESVGKTCTIFCLAENYYAINDKYQMLYGQKLKAMMVAKIKPQGGGKLHLVYIKEVDKFGYIALSTNYALIDRAKTVPTPGSWFDVSVNTVIHKEYTWAQFNFKPNTDTHGIAVPDEVSNEWISVFMLPQ